MRATLAASLAAVAGLAVYGSFLSARTNDRALRTAGTSGHVLVTALTAASPGHVTDLCDSASPLTGVFEVQTGPEGHPAFYVTHDFSTYARVSVPISPSLPTPRWMLCGTHRDTSATRWWTTSDPAVADSYLYESTDGGLQWKLTRRLRCGGSAPWSWVRFVNSTDGWLASGDIGSNCSQFQRTEDGGRTWQTLPLIPTPELGSLEFLTPLTGFAPGKRDHSLADTTDGGVKWHTVELPVPSGRAYGLSLPVFSGKRGVVAMIASHTHPSELTAEKSLAVTIDFDLTSDGGKKWVAGPTLRAVDRTGLDGVERLTVGMVEEGPAVAAASPRTWWVLSLRKSGAFVVRTTRDAGARWATAKGAGLPHIDAAVFRQGSDVSPVPTLWALNDRVAIARILAAPGAMTVIYLTTDGGSRWLPLTRLTFSAVPGAGGAS